MKEEEADGMEWNGMEWNGMEHNRIEWSELIGSIVMSSKGSLIDSFDLGFSFSLSLSSLFSIRIESNQRKTHKKSEIHPNVPKGRRTKPAAGTNSRRTSNNRKGGIREYRKDWA